MKAPSLPRCTWRHLLVAACLAAAAGAADGGTVYYQVTYADGTVRDQPTVPATDADIRLVVRISRVEPDAVGYDVITTHHVPLRKVNAGRTTRTQLAWNGRAWVAPAAVVPDAAAERQGAEAQRADKVDRLTRVLRQRVRADLQRLRARLESLSEAVGRARQRREDAQGPQEKQEAERALRAALEARDACRREIDAAERTLRELPANARALAEPAGEVRPVAGDAARPAGAVAVLDQAADDVQVPARPVRVWPVPEAPRQGAGADAAGEPAGPRTVVVEAAHPEAGDCGAFYYVAYADTDGDGRPDRLIARSPLARADRAGGRTRWRFTADAGSLFVGQACPRPDTSVYGRRVRRAGQRAGGSYVAALIGAVPYRCRSDGWALLGNLRVYVESQHPPAVIETDSQVIIETQP